MTVGFHVGERIHVESESSESAENRLIIDFTEHGLDDGRQSDG